MDMGTLHKSTIDKKSSLKLAGYECECELRKNDDFQNWLKLNENNIGIVEPLNPRESFNGGRTNALKLLYDFPNNECGRYVDFCSLYPTVQFYKRYPTGHPKRFVNPRKTHSRKWFRLIKAKVLAPRKLYHGVLPLKVKIKDFEKLLFPLCKTCAMLTNQDHCEHTADQRAFVGSWTTIELNKAIDKG